MSLPLGLVGIQTHLQNQLVLREFVGQTVLTCPWEEVLRPLRGNRDDTLSNIILVDLVLPLQPPREGLSVASEVTPYRHLPECWPRTGFAPRRAPGVRSSARRGIAPSETREPGCPLPPAEARGVRPEDRPWKNSQNSRAEREEAMPPVGRGSPVGWSVGARSVSPG